MFLLLVEDVPDRERALTRALEGAGHHVEAVAGAGEAIAALARPGVPDLVLVSDTPSDMSLDELLGAAARMGLASSAFVLFGSSEEAGRWVEVTRLGVMEYVPVDSDGTWLKTLSARLEGARERARQRDHARRLVDALESTAAAVLLTAQDGRIEYVNEAGMRLLGRTRSQLDGALLADVLRVDDDESRLRADLRAAMDAGGEWAGELDVVRPDEEHVPSIVTVSPIRRSAGAREGFVLTLRDVADRVAMEYALRTANRRLSELAARDPLTGLYNRGYFRDVLEREDARHVRYGSSMSVLMADLDGFKAVNDQLGHNEGDRVLTAVARALPLAVRDGDVVCRYGGDEFCVLLPSTAEPAARVVARRLLTGVREGPEGVGSGRDLTLSVGLATSPDAASGGPVPSSELLIRADRALMEAKRLGGDHLVTWSEVDADGARIEGRS